MMRVVTGVADEADDVRIGDELALDEHDLEDVRLASAAGDDIAVEEDDDTSDVDHLSGLRMDGDDDISHKGSPQNAILVQLADGDDHTSVSVVLDVAQPCTSYGAEPTQSVALWFDDVLHRRQMTYVSWHWLLLRRHTPHWQRLPTSPSSSHLQFHYHWQRPKKVHLPSLTARRRSWY